MKYKIRQNNKKVLTTNPVYLKLAGEEGLRKLFVMLFLSV